MTALQAGTAASRPMQLLMALAAALLMAAAYVAASVITGQPAAASEATVPSARAAALIKATSGDEAQAVRAVGEEAKLINAALPFSTAPVQAAHAFVIPAGESEDQRRALLCLTQAVYYEAGHEPMDGRRAVAQVVLNRMRHPAFPKSVCGVVYQRNSTPVCQFSFVCDGSLDRRPAASAWNVAEQIARAALAGYVEQSVGAATHYHADYVAPRWAPLLTKINKLGVHIFYRWPGAWGQRAAFNGRYIGEPRDPAALRPAVQRLDPSAETADPVVMAGPVTDGTVLKRAPNDVGGLLDTSKGWTLNIPLPSETGAASKAVAEKQVGPADPAQNDATTPTRVIASR